MMEKVVKNKKDNINKSYFQVMYLDESYETMVVLACTESIAFHDKKTRRPISMKEMELRDKLPADEYKAAIAEKVKGWAELHSETFEDEADMPETQPGDSDWWPEEQVDKWKNDFGNQDHEEKLDD